MSEAARSALYPKVNGQLFVDARAVQRQRRSTRRRTAAPGKARTTCSRALHGIWTCGARIAKGWAGGLAGEGRRGRHAAGALTLAASVASTYNQLARLYALRDIAQHEVEQPRGHRPHHGRPRRGRARYQRRTQDRAGNIATASSKLTRLDGQIYDLRYQLAALLGEGPDRGLQIARPALGDGDAGRAAGQPARRSRGRRPDIVAARWQVDAATHEVKEAKAEFYPDINLAAGDRSRRVRLGPLPDVGEPHRSSAVRRSICRSSMPARCARN